MYKFKNPNKIRKMAKGFVKKDRKIIEYYSVLLLKQQQTVKEYLATPKTNIKKRKLIEQEIRKLDKVVKKAEYEFNNVLSTSEPDYADD